jgi:hypothetical protein
MKQLQHVAAFFIAVFWEEICGVYQKKLCHNIEIVAQF